MEKKKNRLDSGGFDYMVEPRGVEPLSEKRSAKLSTGVAFCLVSFRTEQKANPSGKKPKLYAYRLSAPPVSVDCLMTPCSRPQYSGRGRLP